MNDNFIYHPCNFNAVTEEQIVFVTEGHNFNLLQFTVLEVVVPVLSGFHLTKQWF